MASRTDEVSVVAALSAVETVPPQYADSFQNVTLVPPVSVRQWMETSMFCLQHRNVSVQRLLQMLEDTAKALMEERPPHSQSITSLRSRGSDATGDGGNTTFTASDVTSKGFASTTSASSTSKQQLAARFFMLASYLGIKEGTVSSLHAGVRLAEMAVDAHHCPLTTTHLAWSFYHLGCVVQESESRSTLEAMAAKLTRSTAEVITRRGATFPTDVLHLMKLAWLMAVLGETQTALSLVHKLLDENRADVNALVLLSLLFSANGDYEKALDAANRAERSHPLHIPGGIVLTAMRYVTNDLHQHQRENFEELLAVLMARVQATAQYTSMQVTSEEFSLSPEIGLTVVADGGWSSRLHGGSRAAGHWALLAHVAVEVGCPAVAEIAVRAGLEYVTEAKENHSRAYADLICCAARIKIDRIEKLVDAVHQSHGAAGIEDDVSELRLFEDERLIQEQRTLLDEREVLSLRSMLCTALEVCTAHAESYVQLGRLHLLEALKANQPQSFCATRLVAASHYFQLAINSNAALGAAHEGMGRVREAQGALGMSLDFLASAAVLASRQPVIPFEKFLYLFL
ncbi:mediator of RNA polymerase II transcription subunit 24 [Trypanosoma rangeli]|uniref:Mediator of RNA polymerase II transcription subunit 24 n=1 Tax=Trypanosoma rangeli TaxID=5698 RepID=A0A422P2Z2_TRYRA|nr:mediator of RNA polymerase II transcription subunit 24 [Trypanosoma rangeli]RNF12097.1 mediator of RNA polymerase II transcription subunit 24 [Trypanosoma rangeli]|eukprot:RNF12097.1 mediator of RNA polymerase II transcription subunit 24 [Trypanosoma rangeli]